MFLSETWRTCCQSCLCQSLGRLGDNVRARQRQLQLERRRAADASLTVLELGVPGLLSKLQGKAVLPESRVEVRSKSRGTVCHRFPSDLFEGFASVSFVAQAKSQLLVSGIQLGTIRWNSLCVRSQRGSLSLMHPVLVTTPTGGSGPAPEVLQKPHPDGRALAGSLAYVGGGSTNDGTPKESLEAARCRV